MTVTPKGPAQEDNASSQHQHDFRHDERKRLHQSSNDFLAQGRSSSRSQCESQKTNSIPFMDYGTWFFRALLQSLVAAGLDPHSGRATESPYRPFSESAEDRLRCRRTRQRWELKRPAPEDSDRRWADHAVLWAAAP